MNCDCRLLVSTNVDRETKKAIVSFITRRNLIEINQIYQCFFQ